MQSVNKGVVLLAGKATTLTDAYRAVDVTAAVPGVRRVASELQSPRRERQGIVQTPDPETGLGEVPGHR